MSSDWIDTFIEKTEGMLIPLSFRRWTAIATIAGALERNVFTVTYRSVLFPNLFVILSGEPATGKSLLVNEARKLWVSVSGLQVGPDNPTKASFLDSLQAAERPSVNGSGMTLSAPLSIACREFGVLFPKNDVAFMEDLTDIYDNPEKYTAPRRTTKSVEIDRPIVNILAGATPDKLGDFFPDVAWGQGFTSRLLLIYGTAVESSDRNIFAKRYETDATWLKQRLNYFHKELHGEFEWAPDAALAMNTWANDGLPPVPTYGRLRHYNSRRLSHVLKLAMISAISADHDLNIELSDFERAKTWLLEAEALMPDIFRAMAQKSDILILDDIEHEVRSVYYRQVRGARRPIGEEVIYTLLETRVPSERVRFLIEMAEKTGRIRPGGMPGTWTPGTIETSEGEIGHA